MLSPAAACASVIWVTTDLILCQNMPVQFEWTTFSSSIGSRYSTSADLSSVDILSEQDSLLSFLATAQALMLEMLPLVWNQQLIGFGATSRIHESYGNQQTSFAFKRVHDASKSSTPHSTIYRILTNEILTLCGPFSRNHPNIVQLQGICWEISCINDDAWPVLVFEKADFGDLYSFAMTPIGREMGLDKRLSLCIEMEKAIMDMHSMSMHGREVLGMSSADSHLKISCMVI